MNRMPQVRPTARPATSMCLRPGSGEGARGERATALGTVTQSSNPAVLVSCSLRGATSNPGTPCPCQAADPTSSPALRIAGTCTQQAVTHHAAQRGDGAPTPAMRGGRGHRVGEGRGTPTLQTPAASSALQPPLPLNSRQSWQSCTEHNARVPGTLGGLMLTGTAGPAAHGLPSQERGDTG